MKARDLDHPVVLSLQDRLTLTRFAAIGLIESLAHFVSTYSPDGRIGKWSSGTIAKWVGFDGPPEELIDALLEAGWLANHAEHRLVVPSWPDQLPKPKP